VSRLVFVTQQVDPAHAVLGAAVPQIAALAARVDEVAVLTDTAVAGALPPNCRVREFAARTRAGRGVRFERALLAELSRGRRDTALVAHMCPIYAILAAPFVRPLGLALVLWYAHWRPTPALRLAERVSTAVVSTHRLSLPIESKKLRPIGQAIDVAAFACADGRTGEGPLRLLALGRYSVVKRYDVVVRAVARARDDGVDVELVLHGPCATPAEAEHRAELERLVAELGVKDAVRLGDGVPRAAVPDVLARADAVVNATVGGSSDKALFEACASCVPVAASNPVVADLLPDELRFDEGDVDDLAATFARLARMTAERRRELGRELRARVQAGHSVDTWADGVLRAAGLS
jgi:glycosyltransferase involved in cell wall biosynthesis